MIELVLAAIFGLIIGSFLNVCIHRLPRDLSVVKPARSFCPGCENTIAWYDNLPLVSYFLLRGKCRRCAAPISWRYPLVEFLTAVAFVCAVLRFGHSGLALTIAVFAAIQIALIFTDFEERILPDEFTLGGTALGIILAAIFPNSSGLLRFFLSGRITNPSLLSALDAAFAAAFCAGALWLVAFLYERVRHREGMGFGDVKMVAMIGAFLGLQGALLTIIIGSLLGSVLGLAFIFISRKSMTYELPFGSFLGVGALAVAFLHGT